MGQSQVFKRHELKYILTAEQKARVLKAMEPYMELDKFGRSSIRNIYFDTPDFLLIRRSIERPVYKEKFRIRSYGYAGKESTVFLELKKKYEKIVYKRRITAPYEEVKKYITGQKPFPDTQIGKEIEYVFSFYEDLRPRVYLSYEREAFYDINGSDFRVTFDDNILFRTERLTLDSDNVGEAILPEGTVLMEIKTSGGIPLWMANVLSEQKLYKTSFSKYGTAYKQICLRKNKGVQKYA